MQIQKGLTVPAKDILQIANELFTSLFVLNSRIKFKPVVGRTYWLYRKDGMYGLSLIAPEEWSPSKYGQFIGACKLQTDLTWTLELSEQCRGDRQLMVEITQQREHFDQKLKTAEYIDDILPVYIAALPFYSRVLASALAYSLGQSMQKGEISGLSFNQARRKMLPAQTQSP
ncbi:DUF2452 domain-containing protein [Methylobacter sp. sgz302048]|uniref:DUF2452 domain-containing protein n=1 Tax=Methylobacter sp. sgz302048 TaxID=3455945 RepID=UPI003F9F9F28